MNGQDLENEDIDVVGDAAEQESLAPFVEPTAAEKEARLRALVSSADEREAVHKAVESGDDSDDDTVPLTERATLGMAEQFSLGTEQPFQIYLRAPVILAAAQIRDNVMRWFPDILIGAATSDRYGKGIDIDAAAIFWASITATLNEKIAEANVAGEAEAKRNSEEFQPEKLVAASSMDDLRNAVLKELDDFTACLQSFNFQDPDKNDADGQPHPLNSICDIVWTLAQFDNPKITRAELPHLLVSRLRATEFADLLRAIFRCLSGSDVTYESDPFATIFFS